jgi:hypothetical protein
MAIFISEDEELELLEAVDPLALLLEQPTRLAVNPAASTAEIIFFINFLLHVKQVFH